MAELNVERDAVLDEEAPSRAAKLIQQLATLRGKRCGDRTFLTWVGGARLRSLLWDRHMAGFDPTLDPQPVPIRRVEVITGVGGRRRWDPDIKAEIVMEALEPGAVISDVARRHDLRPQRVFGWLREARKLGQERTPFVPVVVETPALPAPSALRSAPRPKKARRARWGGIELKIDGVMVRVERGAEAKTVAAVIQALKAER